MLYTHYRGKERLRFARQLSDPSGILAPFNGLMWLFSKVPTTPFLDMKHFPELSPLRENWEVFRDEANQLYGEGQIRLSENHDDLAFLAFYKRGWKRFYLKWYGDYQPSAMSMCPRSVEILKGLPSIEAAAFTMLPAGAILGRHRDPSAASLRYHLGLVTPNSDDCKIFIDGEAYSWRDGEEVMFDETLVHWAENYTDEPRIVLLCDVSRPLHTPIMRGLNYAMKHWVISGTKAANIEGDQVGALNRISPYIWGIREGLLKFKTARRRLYYTIKLTLIWSALLAVFVFSSSWVRESLGSLF